MTKIYPDTIESKIGFDIVRQAIINGCSSSLGRELTKAEMTWNDNSDKVIADLSEVDEMVHIMTSDAPLSLTGIVDATPWLKKIEIPGMFAEAAELAAIKTSLLTAENIRAFFESSDTDNMSDKSALYPHLAHLACRLDSTKQIVLAISAIIDDHANVKDSASQRLGDIRREMSTIARRISTAMRRVVANGIASGILDADTSPSIRDGRLVIPVSPMHKRSISGIVHDHSASGKTIFIEPAEIVELSNLERELQIDERREIIRLLIALADEIRPSIPTLTQVYAVLGRFDFISSKAHFAIENNGTMPHFTTKDEITWYGAVHPVLQQHLRSKGREVVPLDLKLGSDEGRGRIIVISGPNAGGKSVALKTVAIIQYMAQCGILPTFAPGSTMKLMQKIFIDIGDDQSIDDDLSTYSSHLKNMKHFLTYGDKNTLFLADEMGSGTEPQIGGALAQALLEAYNNNGMWGVVTTHYQNLKTLADNTPGLINASMLYDRQHMLPLFKLSIGHPGSSFAIEIARKTGLPDAIIDKAGEIVGSDYVNLDKYLLDIARDKRYWETKRENIRRRNKHLEEIIARYESDADDLRSQRRHIIEEARQEAKQIIDQSNAAVEKTIRDIRNAQADRERTLQARRSLADTRHKLDNGDIADTPALAKAPKPQNKKKKDKQPKIETNPPQQIIAGINVLLDNAGQPGTVIEVNDKKATVAFGAMKLSVPISRLTPTIRQTQRIRPTAVSNTSSEQQRSRQLNFKPELDVRGFRADEAIQAITYFIDDAIQFNIGRVRILHGTGTGALRMATRQYLATIPGIKNYHDEDVRFGGAGITVVEFS